MWDTYRPEVRLLKLLKYVNLFAYFCVQLHEIHWVLEMKYMLLAKHRSMGGS